MNSASYATGSLLRFDGVLHVWTLVQTWIVRMFFVLGIVTIAPAAFFLLLDCVLYIWRLVSVRSGFNISPGAGEEMETVVEETDESSTTTTTSVTISTTNTRRRTISKGANSQLAQAIVVNGNIHSGLGADAKTSGNCG